MITARCTAKLLKRLRQPAKLPEPAEATNPLGEWYADLDFIDREPYVALLNASTGAGLLLPGRADDLRKLHIHAAQQFRALLDFYGFDAELPACMAELQAWQSVPVYANTRDRSLLGSLNQFKQQAWDHFAYANRSLPEAAARQWEGLFRPPSKMGAGKAHDPAAWKRPLDLVARKLLPPEAVIEMRIQEGFT